MATCRTTYLLLVVVLEAQAREEVGVGVEVILAQVCEQLAAARQHGLQPASRVEVLAVHFHVVRQRSDTLRQARHCTAELESQR